MIRLGTVFSGIGAIEQALRRMNERHRIVFACDNGDIELKLLERQRQKKYEEYKRLDKKRSLNESQRKEYDGMIAEEQQKIEDVRTEAFSKKCKDENREYVEEVYRKFGKGENYVKKSYLANYKIDVSDFHLDMRFFNGKDYQNKVDLLVGGSPCQSFSTVGKQRGLEDARGTLFYEFARLVKEVRPRVFIYENVQGLKTNDSGRTLLVIKRIFTQDLGYRIFPEQVLNAADYGIPQTRRRLYIVGFRGDIKCQDFEYPKPVKLCYTLQDFLEDKCAYHNFTFRNDTGALVVRKRHGIPDPKFILTPGVQKYVLASGTKTFKTSTATDLPVARTLLKTMTQHHRAGVDNYITVQRDPLLLRALTDREALRLMGFPDDFKIVVPPMQVYRQAGNSIVVDVLMAIVKQIFKTGALKTERKNHE